MGFALLLCTYKTRVRESVWTLDILSTFLQRCLGVHTVTGTQRD